jgi:hypothetical protein
MYGVQSGVNTRMYEVSSGLLQVHDQGWPPEGNAPTSGRNSDAVEKGWMGWQGSIFCQGSPATTMCRICQREAPFLPLGFLSDEGFLLALPSGQPLVSLLFAHFPVTSAHQSPGFPQKVVDMINRLEH